MARSAEKPTRSVDEVRRLIARTQAELRRLGRRVAKSEPKRAGKGETKKA